MPSVLFVDDEPFVLSALERIFRRETLDCVFTCEPSVSLRLLADRMFDVVVSDFMMTGMTGTALLREARRQQPAVARILLTGHADRRALAEAISDGTVEHVIEKPFERQTLVATVHEASRRGA